MAVWHSPRQSQRTSLSHSPRRVDCRFQHGRRSLAGGLVLAVAGQTGALGQGAGSASAPASTMVVVPAGPFVRGDSTGEPDERPQRRIELPAFALDRTEVTRGAYGLCVQQGVCRPPAVPGRPPDPSALLPKELPVAYVSWHDAATYCRWAGKRLPSEAEWEKAARGPDGRRYPWGNDFSCRRGNFGNFAGDGRCADEGAPGKLLPVGSFADGASPYGALDMAGNVWEWVYDPYSADAYRRPPLRPPAQKAGGSSSGSAAGATEPPAGPVPPSTGSASADAAARQEAQKGERTPAALNDRRVLHGGGCCSIFGLPRSADRLALPATYSDADIGFRCARDQPSASPPAASPAPAR